MATLNLPNFTLRIPMWYLKPPTPILMPQLVLNPVQPIEMDYYPPVGPLNMPFMPKTAPPLPKKVGERPPKKQSILT